MIYEIPYDINHYNQIRNGLKSFNYELYFRFMMNNLNFDINNLFYKLLI